MGIAVTAGASQSLRGIRPPFCRCILASSRLPACLFGSMARHFLSILLAIPLGIYLGSCELLIQMLTTRPAPCENH